MRQTDRPAEVHAAGVVLWRGAGSGQEVACVHRPRYDDWSLPKGKLDAGETPCRAALRELTEETGYTAGQDPCAPDADGLGEVRYLLPSGREKVVAYWALPLAGGSFRANDEVDAVAWLPPASAARRLSYATDREVLARFAALHGG